MSLLRSLVSSSRALVTGAKDVARFQEIAGVFVTHGFGWVFSQLKLRRELQVDYEGAELTRAAFASPETGKRLVSALTKLGPTFIKLGQILSTRTDVLPQALLQELATLQDSVDPIPWDDIEGQLVRNLGNRWRDHFAEFDEAPIATASIAQVHQATLKNGQRVAIKVRRPGLRRVIESDVRIIFLLARRLEEAIDEARAMNLTGIINDFAKSVFQELDFRIEARNLERFSRNFSDDDRVVIPGVHGELSTPEVLTMDFIEGRKFSEILEAGEDTSPIVETYFNAAYRMLFQHGFFHGDLHPGNVFVLEGGGLALIDCGMVGRLSPSMKDHIIDILHAVLTEDIQTLARTFHALVIPTERVDYQAFEADVYAIAERYLLGLPLAEIQIGTLLSELATGAAKHRVRMPTDFTMMFKAILTTEGLAKTIAPDLDPLELARPFIEEMVRDRYSLERVQASALRDLGGLLRLVRALPYSLPAVLNELQDGKLAIGVSTSTLAAQDRAARARLRRVERTAIGLVMLATGTYMIGLDLPRWNVVGLPYLTVAFWGSAAAILTLRRPQP